MKCEYIVYDKLNKYIYIYKPSQQFFQRTLERIKKMINNIYWCWEFVIGKPSLSISRRDINDSVDFLQD